MCYLCISWGVGGGMGPNPNQGGRGRDSVPQSEKCQVAL